MKAIPNYPGYYVTKDGKVWSETGKYKDKQSKFLKTLILPNGYVTISLWKFNKEHRKYVHRLILEVFVSPCPDGMETCHNNGIRMNNRLENLRWDSRSNNRKDAVKHGTMGGEKCYLAKLKEPDVRMIIYIWRTKEFTQVEIAKIYNVSRGCIQNIVNKRTWKHIWRK